MVLDYLEIKVLLTTAKLRLNNWPLELIPILLAFLWFPIRGGGKQVGAQENRGQEGHKKGEKREGGRSAKLGATNKRNTVDSR